MKSRSLQPTAKARASTEAAFYQAVLCLETPADTRAFFADLCTPAELEALLDRWSVVGYLEDGLPYRRIHELTGVSVTTIGRVARYLTGGNGGYRKVLDRMRSAGDAVAGARRSDT